jgi:hypothetical protein
MHVPGYTNKRVRHGENKLYNCATVVIHATKILSKTGGLFQPTET